MTRTERRQLERQQAKQNKRSGNAGEIRIATAQTLEASISMAESQGAGSFTFNGVLYVENGGRWIKLDIFNQLLHFPQYLKLYSELKGQDQTEEVIKSLLLTVFITNMHQANEYDLSKYNF
jgi:hypothetical protein